jgi:hypothetical protein
MALKTNLPTYQDLMGNSDRVGRSYGFDTGVNAGRGLQKTAMYGIAPLAYSQIGFGNALEPQRQSAISSALNALDPSNLRSLIDSFGRKARQTAAQQGLLNSTVLRNSGLGTGAVAGAQLDANNQAARQTNDYMSQLLSPQGIQQAYNAYLSMLSNAQNPTALNMLNQTSGGMPASVSSSDGWSSLLGGVASLVPYMIPGVGTAAKAAPVALGALGNW